MSGFETVATQWLLDIVLKGAGDQLVVVQFASDGHHFPDEDYAKMAQKHRSILFIKFVINDNSGLTELADHFGKLTVIFYRNAQELRRLAGPVQIGEVQTEIVYLEEMESLGSTALKKQKTDFVPVSNGSGYEELNNRRAKVSYCELSDMPADFVGKLIGVNFQKLLNREKLALSGVPETNDDLDNLYVRLFNRIVPMISAESYPSDLADETLKSSFAYALLIEVVFELQRKYNLTDDDLVVKRNYPFSAVLGGRRKEIEADFVVLRRKKGHRLFIAVVDCKSSTCAAGLKKCVVYAKECAFVLNGGGVVYGLCSTGVYFNLLKYEPKGDPKKPELDFEVMQQTRFLFADMTNHKDVWKANNTRIVKIVYSILWEQLGLNK